MTGSDPDIVASHAFLPWLRRGLAAWITATELPADGRAEVGVSLAFGPGEKVDVGLPLLGAQDVTGLDARVVIRTWPRADVFDAEPNYLALVELGQADLPWRYTPVAPQDGRLRPWLALVVLAEGELTLEPATEGGAGRNPLPPVVKVHSAAHLPDLAESWAWAHAQVSGMKQPSAGQVETLFEREPHRLRARLLCPRRLAPRTTYTGFLVPAFRRGALAALGETADPAPGLLDPAWRRGADGEVRLPVFFSWRFGTGSAGDFESLARALVAVPELPPGVGTRGIDVQSPGLGLPPAASLPMGLEGALVPPGFKPAEWPEEEREKFQEALASRLALPFHLLRDGGGDARTVVAPPVYGRWHAALGPLGLEYPLTASAGAGGAPPWLAALNGDPRLRVAAGLGTLVVQTLQQELMAGAWAQLDQLRSINETLRFAQLAREGALRLYTRQLVPAAAGPLLQLTAPVHAHLRAEVGGGAGTPTVAAQVAGSTIEGVLTPAWRRLSRPRGALGRRQGRATADAALQIQLDSLIVRLNDGSLAAARPPQTPPGLPTLLQVAESVVKEADGVEGKLRVIGGLALLAAMLGSSDLGPLSSEQGSVQRLLDEMPESPDFTPVEYVPGDPAFTEEGKERWKPAPSKESPDSQAAGAFREALRKLVRRRAKLPPPAEPPKRVDLAGLRRAILAGLDPRETVAARFRRDLYIAPDVGWVPRDPLEPILAAPQIERPMYEPLEKLSQDWLLPGLEHVPANTVALLESNRRFIEAYMVGLSHELSRELVWNEFPTDQRGTYFRQFWDPSGAVADDGSTTADPEALRDITPIHGWGATELGQHRPGARDGGEHAVLLVRSELLRRYPGAGVYATWSATAGPPSPGDRELHPVFRGALPPDVAFYGFAIRVDELLATDEDGRRWYLVVEEPAGEPRFGFDEGPPESREPFAGASDGLGETAAQVAARLFQQPVRVLIPAARLLNRESGP